MNDQGKILVDDSPKLIGEIKLMARKRIAANPKIIFSVVHIERTKYQGLYCTTRRIKKSQGN